MKQERAFRTRRVIIDAAAEIFSRHGYERSTIAEILNTAGITKGALYFHFSSKEELAAVILAEHTEYLPRSESDSPLQRAIDFSQAVAHAMAEDSLMRAGARLTAEGTFGEAPDPYHQWITTFSGLFHDARVRGEILHAVDVQAVVELVVGAFTGLNLLSYMRSDQRDLPLRVRDMWQHLLPGVAHPAVLNSLRLEGSDRSERMMPARGTASRGGALGDDAVG